MRRPVLAVSAGLENPTAQCAMRLERRTRDPTRHCIQLLFPWIGWLGIFRCNGAVGNNAERLRFGLGEPGPTHFGWPPTLRLGSISGPPPPRSGLVTPRRWSLPRFSRRRLRFGLEVVLFPDWRDFPNLTRPHWMTPVWPSPGTRLAVGQSSTAPVFFSTHAAWGLGKSPPHSRLR
ncbi:hypothetical protein K456DRAFT_465274 [Colletotrichum gloeosporioides 23]|nr:hypothetical protein K456DRAFT_465274 [Colletotrichum gloeosporioides 23]